VKGDLVIYTLTLNPAIDYVMHPTTLDMGFTNRSSSEEIYCGGNGINVSTVLNELGTDNVALGVIAGFTGEYILSTLQEAGVNCNFVKLERGFTRINVKLDGIVMTIVNGMGPKIPPAKVEEVFKRLDRIDKGDTLVLTGSIPKCLNPDMYLTIQKRLEGRGIRFVVDAPGQLLIDSLPAKPFMIKPNNHEVGRIFKSKPETPEECMPFAHKLHEMGAQNVIVSCGKHGSALVDENDKEHVSPVPPCRLVNATGSGDSMVAGFLSAVDSGMTYGEALRFASACGSATASSKGLARRATIDRLYAKLQEMKSSKSAK
jgi:1-phosphofructokinase